MKSLTKRNLTLIVLSVVVALCSLTFAATVKPARAEDVTPITVGTLEVMEEASIRIGTDVNGNVGGAQSGIRFRARVDKATYEALTAENSPAYMGFLITPKQLYNDRAAAEDESYGKDDYINSISNYVGDQGTGIKVTKGFYEEDGYYYANAAVNNMFEKNIELDFTAVAYIWDGKEYKYSAPSEDFGRTYKQVVTKAFIDGHNPEHLKLAAYVGDTAEGQEDGFVSTLVNGAPITIDNSNDLYNLSNAVANGVDSFEKSNFVLSGNMEVDYDFVAIDASMIKSITANEGATVTVYNNKGLEDSILAEGTIDNLTVKNETKLFNMTEKSLDLIWYHDSENRPNNFIESEKLPEISYDGNTTIRYPEKIKGRDAFHREGSNADQIAFKLNYSKQELLDLYNAGTYNTVELTCMLSLKNGGTSVANRIIESSYCDYGIFGAFAENTYVGDTSVYLGRNIQDFSLGYEAWRTYKINLDNFIKAIHDTNFDSKEYTTEYAYLTQFGTFASSDTPAAIFDFYVLDIELVKDVETIWSTEVGVGNDGYQSALGAGVWSYKPTDLSATGYEKDAETGISSAYMTLADTSKNFYAKTTHPEALPTSYTDKNSETVAIDNTGIGECLFLTVQSNSTMMLQARFSSSEIKKIAEKEGYTHVKVKMLYYASTLTSASSKYWNNGKMPNELLSKTGIATLPFGSKDMACKNTWVEFSISVEDFLLCMGGADGGYATDKFTYAPNETKASLIIPDNGIIMRGGYSNSRNVYLESIKFDTSTAAQ